MDYFRFVFFPFVLIGGDLSTKYPQGGGVFIRIKEAFGVNIAWISTVFYLVSCVVFFLMLLFFGFSALAYTFGIINKSLFIGLGSMFVLVVLTFLNILGIKWIKRINSILMYYGIFIPFFILMVYAFIWCYWGGGFSD